MTKRNRFLSGVYVLRGKLAIPIDDVLEWGMEFEQSHRIVAQTNFPNVEPWLTRDTTRHRDSNVSRARLGMGSSELVRDPRFAAKQILVSTVFLGLDMSFGDGDPLLFETMVFNGPLDNEMDRYSSWVEAEAGHESFCTRVKRALLKGRIETP